MKKLSLLIVTVLLACMHLQSSAQSPVIGACYYSKDGTQYIKLKVTPTTTSAYLWYNYTPGNQQNIALYSPYIPSTLDPDGINIDYFFFADDFINNVLQSGGSYSSAAQGSNCTIQYYFSDQNAIPPNLATDVPLTICYTVPTPMTSCYEPESNNVDFHLRLAFDHTTDNLGSMYIWSVDDLSTPYLASPVLDPDGIHMVFTATMLATSFTNNTSFDIPRTFYYFYDNSFNGSTNPQAFAAKITIYPCFSGSEDKYVYSINSADENTVHFVNSVDGLFTYGDPANSNSGSYFALEQYFTYPGGSNPASYGTSYTPPPGLPGGIVKNETVCVPNVTSQWMVGPLGFFNQAPGPGAGPTFTPINPCNVASFIATFDKQGVVTVTPDFPFSDISTTITTFDFGDGTGSFPYTQGAFPFNPLSHMYTSAGTYDIEMIYNVDEGGIYTSCYLTMDGNCVALKQAPNTTAVMQTTQAIDAVKLAPNPATDMSFLTFTLGNEDNVTVVVIDAAGHVVANVLNQQMSVGNHKVEVSTASLSAGLYNVSIQTSKGLVTQKLSVVK